MAMIQHLLSQVGVDRGAHLLDAGCGAGRMMLTYLEQLDPSLQLAGIGLAQGRARQRAGDPLGLNRGWTSVPSTMWCMANP
jgi:cyclopropane fatty-acyl-phospholipid synthase-like methyltransferase